MSIMKALGRAAYGRLARLLPPDRPTITHPVVRTNRGTWRVLRRCGHIEEGWTRQPLMTEAIAPTVLCLECENRQQQKWHPRPSWSPRHCPTCTCGS